MTDKKYFTYGLNTYCVDRKDWDWCNKYIFNREHRYEYLIELAKRTQFEEDRKFIEELNNAHRNFMLTVADMVGWVDDEN